MSMTDPIADLLTRIRNAQMALHETVEVPYSRLKAEVARILAEEGYIRSLRTVEGEPVGKLVLELKYDAGRTPAIRRLQRVSRPGRRVYTGKDEIPAVLAGMGINIISTSKGLMTGKQARRQGVGGEVLCEIY